MSELDLSHREFVIAIAALVVLFVLFAGEPDLMDAIVERIKRPGC